MYFNAHCHLELSFAAGKIKPGLDFCEWIMEVIKLRRTTSEAVIKTEANKALRQMQKNGITTLWDIDSMGLMDEVYPSSSINTLSFQELIALDKSLSAQRIDDKKTLRNKVQSYGFSPHAPYSASDALIQNAFQFSTTRDELLCIHCSETPEENEFLLKGIGPFRDMLESLGALPEGWKPPQKRTVEYLHHLGVLGPKTLLVHCNEITDQELKILAETKTKVVVCPGTHVYFCRGDFPLARLLNAGCDVYLGTDSLASNESLDMEREASLACELCPELSKDLIHDLIAKTPPQ